MDSRGKSIFVLGLCLCFLFVSTTFAQQQPSATHHQSHDQHSHSQSWCSWSCQAGQAVSVDIFYFEITEELLDRLALPTTPSQIFPISKQPSSRGPPVSLHSKTQA